MPDANPPTNSGYPFRPLERTPGNGIPRRLIKIVRLGSTLEDSRIFCTLKHFPDESCEVPSYDAVSYVWGNPGDKKPIYLKDDRGDAEDSDSEFHEHLVHQNLWDLLDHMRHHTRESKKTEAWFWTDFLCIDQGSDEEIREHLPRMKEIYSEAEKTIAWLGPYHASATPDKSPSPNDLERIDEAYSKEEATELDQPSWTAWVRRLLDTDGNPLGKPRRYTRVTSFSEYRDPFEHEDPIVPSDRHKKWSVHEPVNRILSLPYWTRVWIIQEVVLAKEVELRFGDRTLDFGKFVRAYQARFYWSWKCGYWLPKKEAVPAVEARIARDDISIREIVEWSQRCECSKPVDRVYGLLGLFQERRVDYKTAEAVYLDAVFGIRLRKLDSGNLDFNDFETIVDQLGKTILDQPSPSFTSEDFASYFGDTSNTHVLHRGMARIVNRIANVCADIGFESARVRKGSLDWEPAQKSSSQQLLDYRKSEETADFSFQSTMASLFLEAFPISTTGSSPLVDKEIKAAVIGIRLAQGRKRAEAWGCLANDDTDKCPGNHQQPKLKFSCNLQLRDEADRVSFRKHNCRSLTHSEGRACQHSTFSLDIKHDGYRLRLTLENPQTDAALTVEFRYEPPKSGESS